MSDIEARLSEAYQKLIGEKTRRHGDSATVKGIRPSDIPDRLPIVSDEEIQRRQVTWTPREVVPEWVKRVVENDDTTDDEGDRSWKRARKERTVVREDNITNVRIQEMFEISSGSEEEKVAKETDQKKRKDKASECPFEGCETRTTKIRNHVNRFHLPRIMWDNHSPPVRRDRYNQLNRIRYEVLVFLSCKIVGSEDVEELRKWSKKQKKLVPQKSVLLGRHIEQMRGLTDTMGWRHPPYKCYKLRDLNHRSLLIHWRFQVALLQRLRGEEIGEYMSMGLEFMNDPNNFVPATRRTPETLVSKSLFAPTISTQPQPEWDQGKDKDRIDTVDEESVVVVDQCGETDEVDLQSCLPTSELDEESVERKVMFGPHTYTLVLRATTLGISGVHRRLSTPPEPEDASPKQIQQAYDIYDSHFHLDRSSTRLLGNLKLTMEQWLEEPMERPPTVPVNVVGGMLVYCDPDTFPSAVPEDNRWKVAVGLHPRKAQRYTADDVSSFLRIIGLSWITAVGEIGLDRTSDIKYWESQMELLNKIIPAISATQKPVIFHVRSHRNDKHSTFLYLLLLKFLTEHVDPQNKIILHCFTGSSDVLNAYLSAFGNTFFGFTYLAAHFDKEQKSALRTVPMDHLLLETDSPYIAPWGINNNSPLYLGEVADKIASIRGDSVEEICRQTTANAKVAYGC